MEKNWLIRTKARQILGPVGKQKILEFVEKGSLSGDDEVSSGNGYWFSIKERELLEKYVYGDLPQGFNPITEAPNILTANLNSENEMTGSLNPNTMPKKKDPKPVVEEVSTSPDSSDLDYPSVEANSEEQLPSSDDLAFPDSGDLDYPDMGESTRDDITMVGSVADLQQPASAPEPTPAPAPTPQVSVGHVSEQVPSTDEEGKLPMGTDLEYPDMGIEEGISLDDNDQTDPMIQIPSSEDITKDDIVFSEVSVSETPEVPKEVHAVAEPEKKKPKKKKVKTTKKKKKSQRNDRFLLYILVGLILLIFYGAFYYFTNIINSDASISNPFINKVYAQSMIGQIGKKKTLLSSLL